MLQGETWRLALVALRANKMRAVLTMLGVVIGSACIVLVVTVALAGRRYIVGQIEGIGANLVFGGLVDSGTSRPLVPADQVDLADLEAVKRGLPGVITDVAGSNFLPLTIDVNGHERLVNVVGVTEGFDRIRNLEILRGRYFDPDDIQSRTKVCLLTEDLSRRVFPYENPIGKDIRIGELHFSVIGVFRESVATLGQTEITRESVLVPFFVLPYFTGTAYVRTMYATADNSEDVPLATREVEQILKGRHRAGVQYRVENLTGILETAREIALALTIFLVVVALIALAISGIGIMNIMLVTVTERTREIGILKAIGASQYAIRYQFLLEATLISGTGALAGILIAISIPALLNFLLGFFPEAEGITVPVSWISVVSAFVVSCSTGLIFGYLPANRAAKLQPTESLRYE
jgi:putative ABC transport system permease protein